MGNNVLTLAPVLETDIGALPFWYELAGVARNDPREEVAGFLRAFNGGYLGVATGDTRRKNLETMLGMDPRRWYFARLAVRVLKLNGESIGMLIMGSHHRLWKLLDSRMADDPPMTDDEFPPGLANFVTAALCAAKIHLVAVHPDHQGAGHGSRLLNAALGIARVEELLMLYGQFGPNRPQLPNFYSSKGFRVLQPGEPLHVGMATGKPDLIGAGDPNDTFFVCGTAPDDALSGVVDVVKHALGKSPMVVPRRSFSPVAGHRQRYWETPKP